MGKIKITYYEYINDVEVAFENAINEIKEYQESHFEVYDLTVENLKEEYLEDFKKWYSNQLARVEYNRELIEHWCFVCDGYVFYNLEGDNVCFTNQGDVDFENIERYVEMTRDKLSQYAFDFDDICNLSADIEPREIDYVENVYFESDDIKEY